MNNSNVFEMPKRLISDGHIKNMSREALMVMLCACFGIDPEQAREATGLSYEELFLATAEAYEVMGKIGTAQGAELPPEPDMLPIAHAMLVLRKNKGDNPDGL